MLIEHANHPHDQVQLVPFFGMVNPEHLNGMNCIPIIRTNTNEQTSYLEDVFLEDFLRKCEQFRRFESLSILPIEIRLGTVYTYQNRRQEHRYPRHHHGCHFTVDLLRKEEQRAHHEKHFLITFNKNKGINDLQLFEHQLICTGFRSNPDHQLTYRLYLRDQNKRIILELKRQHEHSRCFAMKRLLKYSTKFTHIDVVKCKSQSKYPRTFEDIFDIRTSIGKALEEEELDLNDELSRFLDRKTFDHCMVENYSDRGQPIYHFHPQLMPFFDFFQIKQTRTFDYSCMDSRFFGLRIVIEHQMGYDFTCNSTASIPCLQTANVIMAKLLSHQCTKDEAKRIWSIGQWLSELATRCTNRTDPSMVFSS